MLSFFLWRFHFSYGAFIFPYLIVGFLFGSMCAGIASTKGLSAGRWFANGLLFNFVGLIAIAGMPDLKSQKYLRRLAEALPAND
jgi:hypothetical protein